jgi:diguanylate cyclase (GGDEF)-like protein
MKNTNATLRLLAIGLDSFSMEAIKAALLENGVPHQISFIRDIDELEATGGKSLHAVFFHSNRQNQKTIDELRRIHSYIPQAAMILLSPRPDHHGVVGAFRAGLFDFLTLPIEPAQSGRWTPERAVLHLFSRPESFSSVGDIAANLSQYLGLFFEIKKELHFSQAARILPSLQRRLRFSDQQVKRIQRFLNDETGLIFGLRFVKDRFYFLIKTGDEGVSYLVARNVSEYPLHAILSDYLSNVLRTSLSILSDSRKREEIRILSITDEVTGLFNQRKLVEDLETHISRYNHDQVGFSLLFIDIDFFKHVNDQFGHVVGSQLLTDMAHVVKSQLRSTDLVYRYGGDEFIVLLPKSSVDEAKKIALRVSRAVKGAEFSIEDGRKYKLSLSVGIAGYPEDAASAKAIIDFADKMMYLSKKSGRGKVFHVTEVVA